MDADDIQDLFRAVGPVSVRRMFGGKGIYADGMIIALDLFDGIMLKGDKEAGRLYEEAGSAQWTYTHAKSGKPVAMPYWPIPGSAYDDPDEAAQWVRIAYDAARRLA
ncbi:DNA transformation protein [Rhizobium sp. SG_E_25_P2]|uniref:TfoX/Sxy family protein n=1 Tax=Rhizobium sp. SG_E_25_P2 TaxID=2879942 RepID=UPI0024750189|nr:TfoX/Sxy family protein [Rhizobium sp. SG_E_25_P2]MDH6267160.1 DNA transformation protein [Rhizobium sp. SG_E_25_P2]